MCENIPAAKALEWGLINQVVPRAQLDAAVDDLCRKLIDKMPECTRYTKQQLNFWRDLSWHMTIGHALDWLALHNLAPEVREGIRAFIDKRPVDYAMLRRSAAADGSGEVRSVNPRIVRRATQTPPLRRNGPAGTTLAGRTAEPYDPSPTGA